MKRMIATVSAIGLLAALVAVFAVNTPASAQAEKDPHRPACSTAQCRKIKSFLKAHYCGESPFGNGPDDGCEIKGPTKSRPRVEVLADFHCEYIESKHDSQCGQVGQPSASVRKILVDEMQRIGVPANANGETHFWVWKPNGSDWLLAEVDYSHPVGDDIELC